MKDRLTVRHGMLTDLANYLSQSGWKLETPVGQYEVLRARRQGYLRPLLIYDRTSGGCGYSIDERDIKVYQGWQRNRRRRGLDPNWPTEAERQRYFEGKDVWVNGKEILTYDELQFIALLRARPECYSKVLQILSQERGNGND